MGIRKRGAVWWVDVTVSGRRIQRSTGTADKRAAKEYHDRLKAQVWREAEFGERPATPWTDACAAFLRERAGKRSIEDDRDKLRWLTAKLGKRTLGQITPDLIDPMIDGLVHHRQQSKAGTPVSGATKNRYVAVLVTVLNMAVAKGWLVAVPRFRRYAEPKTRLRWLTQDEANRLLEELPAHLRQMARFALATGLRKANVAGLRWEQIDMARAVAWIQADESKSGKPISVPLNDDAMAVLRERQGVRADVVFSYEGRPIVEPAGAAWKKALVRAGIEREFRWHDLRRTWACWHAIAGTPMPVLQRLGGWSSNELVMVYATLQGDQLGAFANNITVARPALRVVGGGA